MFAVPSSEPQLDAAAAATATSRLQLQSLKAAAQRIGLGNGSMGMGMIDAIFDKGARARGEGGDWADLLKVLTSGKVSFHYCVADADGAGGHSPSFVPGKLSTHDSADSSRPHRIPLNPHPQQRRQRAHHARC